MQLFIHSTSATFEILFIDTIPNDVRRNLVPHNLQTFIGSIKLTNLRKNIKNYSKNA